MNKETFKHDFRRFLAYLESSAYESRHKVCTNTNKFVNKDKMVGIRNPMVYVIMRFIICSVKSFFWIVQLNRTTDRERYGRRSIIFFAHTKNNFIVLKKLSTLIENEVIIIRKLSQVTYRISFWRSMHIWFNCVFETFFVMIRYLRRDLKHYFESMSAFYYVFYYRMFSFADLNGIKLVGFANDHSPSPVAFRDICNATNIKTFYIQHSFINDLWPKLQYTFAILESEYSQMMHIDRIGSTCKTFVLGNFYTVGKSRAIKHIEKIKNIGIAVDRFTLEIKLKMLLKQLFISYPHCTIVLRQHPAIAISNFRKSIRAESYRNRIIFNDGSSFNMDTFTEQIDVLIAGNSNILLEVLLMGVPSLYCSKLDELFYDHYGFVRNDIISELDISAPIESQIEHYCEDDFRKKLYYFDASYLKPLTTIKNNVNEIINSYVS